MLARAVSSLASDTATGIAGPACQWTARAQLPARSKAPVVHTRSGNFRLWVRAGMIGSVAIYGRLKVERHGQPAVRGSCERWCC